MDAPPRYPLLPRTHGGGLEAAGIDVGHGFDLLSVLCERFPMRTVGSPGERGALDFLGETLLAAGMTDLSLEPVSCLAADFSRCVLRINGPGGNALEACPVLFTGSTRPGGVTAPLSYADHVTDVDFRDESLRGRMLIVFDGFGEYGIVRHYRDACQAGLAGLVVVRDHEFATLMALPNAAAACGSVPVVGVAHHTGMEILKSGAATVFLDVQTRVQEVTGHNLVARLPACGPPIDRQVVLLSTHHDTNPIGPNAADNTVGVAMAAEVVRTLARANLRRDLWLVSYTAEELAFEGSLQFARDHGELVERCALQLYYDGHGTIVGRNELFVTGDPSLLAFFQEIASSISHRMDARHHFITLDPIVLAAFDVPAVHLDRRPQRTWHTPYDVPEDLAPEAMRSGIHLYAEAAHRLANLPEMPFPRRVSDGDRARAQERLRAWTPRTLAEAREGLAKGLAR
ncbi:MAG: M28 family peptidase [Planctomycetes bacterium]|nr:M28 family peptidase [Planctomycetota bacterium]